MQTTKYNNVSQYLSNLLNPAKFDLRCYCSPDRFACNQKFPAALKSVFRSKWHLVRLNINGYRFGKVCAGWKTIPMANVVSFEGLGQTPSPWRLRYPSGKLLSSARRLQSLQLLEFGDSDPLVFKDKLPPIRKLEMSHYIWNPDVEEVERIFDFSKLESLIYERGSVESCHKFLHSLQPASLQHSRVFTCTMLRVDQVQSGTKVLLVKLIGNLKELRELTLSFYDTAMLVESLADAVAIFES